MLENVTFEEMNSPMRGKRAGSFTFGGRKTGCVLIHGFTGTPWTLQDLGVFLTQHNISVSIPLLPGHGTKPSDLIGISWKEWVKVCRIEVEKIRKSCDEVFLVGLSMGGTIALLLVTEIACDGVITLSAPVILSGFTVRLLSFLRFFVRYWKKKPFSFSSSSSSQMGYDRYPLVAVLEFIKLLDYVRNLLAEVVNCPVLVIHGRNDREVDSLNAELIYNGISSTDKRKILLDSSHHIITRGDDKKKVEEEVFKFIRSHSAVLK